MTPEECIRTHQRDLKYIQGVTIVLVIGSFILGLMIGFICGEMS